MFLMFLLVMFTAFFTTLLPYLLKIIIDYSAQAYNFPLDIRLPFNLSKSNRLCCSMVSE
jgi:ATP-binding cassette subfamily B protein